MEQNPKDIKKNFLVNSQSMINKNQSKTDNFLPYNKRGILSRWWKIKQLHYTVSHIINIYSKYH